MYGAVDDRFLQNVTLTGLETAVTVANDPTRVFRDILQVFPDTQTVFVIMGAGDLGRVIDGGILILLLPALDGHAGVGVAVPDSIWEFRVRKLKEMGANAYRTAHNPPTVRGKPRRFYYVTQLKAGPPTFALFSNVEEPLHFSYKRYLDNQFREGLGLVGTPMHFVVRARKGMKKEK